MKVLLLESTNGIASNTREQLERSGDQVLTCVDPQTQRPCRAVTRPAECPFVQHGVDVAIVVRRQFESDTLLEMGAVCAERHRSSVVHLDPTQPTSGEDLHDVIGRAKAAARDRAEAECSAAVRDAVGASPLLVESSRSATSIRVALTLDDSDLSRSASLADAAGAAARRFDPFVRTIDVSVISSVPRRG